MNKLSTNRILIITAAVMLVLVIAASGIILGLFIKRGKDDVPAVSTESESIVSGTTDSDEKFTGISVEGISSDSTKPSETEETEKSDENKADYKKAYRQYFEDVFAGRTGIYHPEGAKYGDNGEKQKIFMTLMDITDDGIPELLVESPSFDVAWQAYTIEGDEYKSMYFGDNQIDFYDPDNKRLYLSCPYAYTLSFDVYKADNGNLTGKYRVEEGCEDYDWGEDQSMYYEFADGWFSTTGHLLSDEDAKTLWDEYNSGLERYRITGTEITPENLDQYFGE